MLNSVAMRATPCCRWKTSWEALPCLLASPRPRSALDRVSLGIIRSPLLHPTYWVLPWRLLPNEGWRSASNCVELAGLSNPSEGASQASMSVHPGRIAGQEHAFSPRLHNPGTKFGKPLRILSIIMVGISMLFRSIPIHLAALSAGPVLPMGNTQTITGQDG
jgi:hypothetical protein